MKKILLAASLAAACSMSWAQTGEVPPDYPAQAAQYPTNPVDAQIEAVRRNYEDVKARAQLRLDAERRAKSAKPLRPRLRHVKRLAHGQPLRLVPRKRPAKLPNRKSSRMRSVSLSSK